MVYRVPTRPVNREKSQIFLLICIMIQLLAPRVTDRRTLVWIEDGI